MSLHVPVQEEKQLTSQQERLIAALLAGNNIQVAASIAGVSEKTADRWLALPHVQKAYKNAQQVVFDEAINLLITDISDARATLNAIMKDTETPAATRVRAAQILLEKAIDLRKVSDLERQIAELRQLLKEQNR
jgi:phage terminase small subunit